MNYSSNITREQYEIIRPILEGARKKTKPLDHDLYDVFNAVLYIVTTGCQWRNLPNDFPKWSAVYHHFQIWTSQHEDEPTLLDVALKKLSFSIDSYKVERKKQPS
jgi:transposase